MQLSGAQILIRELAGHGVTTVFGYPGGAVLDIYDRLQEEGCPLRHVLTAHEQGAAHAADGYARASGGVGVVIATSGPGATNLVTGIATAYLDSVPLIAITGNVAAQLLGRDSFQEVDIIGVTQPIVKHSFLVKDVCHLAKTLCEAFAIATTGRRGPVLVDLPKSVQTAVCDYQPPDDAPPAKRQAPDIDVSAAVAAIRQSRRPFLYCGGGVLAAGAEAEAMALSRRLSAPIGLSMMGLTSVPHSFPLNLGMCGMHGRYAATRAQSEADLIIAAGVRFSERATGNTSEYTGGRTVLHIDIDTAEIGKNIRPQIGLCGDVKDILAALLPAVPEMCNREWVERALAGKQADEAQARPGFTPRAIIRAVAEALGPDALVATDVGQHQMWTMQHYPFERQRSLLTSGGLGTMGFGLGAAIGGCIQRGGRRTVLFTSDGSFGMNLTELATAVSQRLPIAVVLLNNGSLGMVRQWQTLFYGGRYSQTTLHRQTDFPALARAFGAEGARARTLSELHAALAELPEDGPCVIDCPIDMDEQVLPMIPPGGSIKNIMMK